MDTWIKIRNNIYTEKLNEIDNLFNSAESRSDLSSKLKAWAAHQHRAESLGLSLQEYKEVSRNLQNINETFFYEFKDREFVNSIKEEFKKYYSILLEQKEKSLKLEVVAELVEEKKVPLDIFAEWYLENKELPQKQFQEALGEFWGDVWKHAKHGAAAGALGGGVAGALGTGGLGTFAGAGIGGLVGGLGGGAYGAGKHLFGGTDRDDRNYRNDRGSDGGGWGRTGKHLLNKVWDWRKNQTEFEKTKKEASIILQRLKGYSDKFEMDPNFTQLLDTMIHKLGGVKAYKTKTPEQPATQPIQQAQPQAEPQNSGPFQVSAPGGDTQTAANPTNIMHQSNTGTVPSSHVADVGIHSLPGDGSPVKKKRVKKPLETPEEAPVEEKDKPIQSKEDVLHYLHKPGLDDNQTEERLIKLGLALNLIGDPDDFNDVDFDLLRHGLMHDVKNIPEAERVHYKQKALAYQNYLAKKTINTEPENKPIPNQPAPAYSAEDDPAMMKTSKFKEYLKGKGMWQDDMGPTLGKPGSDKRLQFIADNGVTETVEKYKDLLRKDARPVFLEHKIGYLGFEARLALYKEALRRNI